MLSGSSAYRQATLVGVYTRVPPRSTNSRTNLTVGVTFTSTEPGGDLSLFIVFTPGTSSGGKSMASGLCRWLRREYPMILSNKENGISNDQASLAIGDYLKMQGIMSLPYAPWINRACRATLIERTGLLNFLTSLVTVMDKFQVQNNYSSVKEFFVKPFAAHRE